MVEGAAAGGGCSVGRQRQDGTIRVGRLMSNAATEGGGFSAAR